MSFKLASLFVDISAQTETFDKAMRQAKLDLAEVGDSAAKGQGGGQFDQMAGDMAGSLLPLGSKIQQAIVGAMAPLNQFAARFSAQFETVGATVMAISRRIDDHIKFPQTQANLEGLRNFARSKFTDIDGNVTGLGRRIDKILGGAQAFSKLGNQFSLLGSAVKGSFDKVGKVKVVGPDFRTTTKNIYNLRGAADAAAGSFKRMGAEVALALGAFGLVFKAVQFLKDGIKGASDLGETVSKVGTVFGSATGKITAQADDLAKRFGLVKGPILDAAASFGLIGKASGQNAQEAAALANQMTALAADASSFYNIPLDSALEKLRSGLVGEAEPMRSLGVLLSETAVANEAFRLGLAKSAKGLTEQNKVQARASLIAKGLKDATGDLDRTQGSTANQFRKFTGTIVNLGTSIGEALLPAITTGVGLLNEFATWVGRAFEGSRGSFESFAAGLSTTFEYVGAIFRNWKSAFEVARLSILQGLINLGEYFEVLGPNIGLIAEYIGRNWYQLISDAVNATLTVFKNFGKNISALGTAIGEFLADPTQGFKPNWTKLLDGFEATAEKLPELIKPHLTDMSDQIAAAGRPIFDDVQKRADAAKKAAAAAAQKGIVDESGQAGAGKKSEKSTTSDLAAFAKDIQEAVSGKGKDQAAIRKAVERTAKAAEKTAQGIQNAVANGIGGAAGPNWQVAGLA